jgi:hypothetical protein
MKRIMKLLISLGLVSSLLLLFGCAGVPRQSTTPKSVSPQAGRIDNPVAPESVFERMSKANNKQLQDFKRSSSVTFHKGNGFGFASKSSDQKDIVGLEGPPDYVRKFQVTRGETIEEWLYESKNYQLQFKQGVLEYCSPIDDQSKKVLEYGQPTKVISEIKSGGKQKNMFWYKGIWKMIVFNDGKLVGIQ